MSAIFNPSFKPTSEVITCISDEWVNVVDFDEMVFVEMGDSNHTEKENTLQLTLDAIKKEAAIIEQNRVVVHDDIDEEEISSLLDKMNNMLKIE